MEKPKGMHAWLLAAFKAAGSRLRYTLTSLLLFSEERKYKCHLCPYAAKCRANLNQHLTVHSVKLVSTDTEDIVSAVTAEGSDGKKHPYYYR